MKALIIATIIGLEAIPAVLVMDSSASHPMPIRGHERVDTDAIFIDVHGNVGLCVCSVLIRWRASFA